MLPMWEMYDELLAAVPPDLTVTDCLMGLHWTLVRSNTVGVAMTPFEGESEIGLAGKLRGMPVRMLAGYVKSWNSFEATLGLAAINSVFNSAGNVEGLSGRALVEQSGETAFSLYHEAMRGKKVAVIGHFPGVESLAEICQLSILERRPQHGDFPDPACEYILPEQDYVFVTATTIVNKTLPRLLDLARQAFVVLVGPSTPLTPILFDHGVGALCGTVTVDPEALWRIVQEGGCHEIFRTGGRMVRLIRV
jgi:uncharacterized protein